MSKSQSEFPSPKKLCRALHSEIYVLIYKSISLTFTSLRLLSQNITPQTLSLLQDVRDVTDTGSG